MAHKKTAQAEPTDNGEEMMTPDETGGVQETLEAETASDDLPDVTQLQDQLTQLQEALATANDQVLRTQAEAQNTRRRAELDVEKAHKFALDKFTNELLPVVDSLELALQSTEIKEASVEAIHAGVEMTLKMLVGALGKFRIAQINPEGEPFDPQYHQAVSVVENPEVEPNSVIAVMQKGYTLNDRLVRPAMVMVSKAAPKIDEKA
jgi:molecular chaperone GrpE